MWLPPKPWNEKPRGLVGKNTTGTNSEGLCGVATMSLNSVEKEVPSEKKIKLKILPDHLKYVFLEEDKPVVISSTLTTEEENRLVDVLKKHREAMGYILDLKGISPAYCMHRIMMEEDYKPI